MIGPSSGSGSVGGETTADEHHHHHHHHHLPAKRRVLEELDIESICDEVCGHHHHQPAKRPRFLTDLQGTLLLDGHDAVNLQDNLIYAPFDEQQHHHHHHYHHQEDGNGDGPVTRLEVLVVDGTWDDALESFEAAAAAAATQPCDTALTELSLTHEQQQAAQQQQQLHSHDLQNLQDINYQSYWSPDQVQHQPTDYQEQPPQEQQPQQQQQQTTTTMPKVQQSSADANRTRNGFGAPAPTMLPASSYEDQENGNLSWLLDFKLDSFIEAPEDKSTGLAPRDFQGNKAKYNGSGGRTANAYTHESTKRTCNYEASAGGPARYDGAYSPSSYGALAENRNRCTGPKKPPFTYTELIEHALQERGELTVSAIYQWISEHFPYYKSNDDRWKNSVRHNLSINPHFRKGSKAPHGAGHLWAIASQDESKPRQFFNIASIRQALKDEEAINAQKTDTRAMSMDEEVAAATASIAQPVDEESICETITMEHCAEQILSGIKKEVEVQYLVPMMLSSNGEVIHSQQCHSQSTQLCTIEETDFLNPVPNKIAAEECGLEECGYLVTDLNPSSLGLNMSESEVVTTDNLFGEELSFQFYEFASSSQLQSA